MLAAHLPLQTRLLQRTATEALHTKRTATETPYNTYFMRTCVPSLDAHVQVLVGNICLRRTKDMQVGGRCLVELPARIVHFVEVGGLQIWHCLLSHHLV